MGTQAVYEIFESVHFGGRDVMEGDGIVRTALGSFLERVKRVPPQPIVLASGEAGSEVKLWGEGKEPPATQLVPGVARFHPHCA